MDPNYEVEINGLVLSSWLSRLESAAAVEIGCNRIAAEVADELRDVIAENRPRPEVTYETLPE